jgi:hypothetical protein
MADINLTQIEADFLFSMKKVTVNTNVWDFPTMGEKIEIPLISEDKRERFVLDIDRGTINLKKIKYQNRVRQVVILVRIDLNGPPHRNPDGTEIPPSHIDRYREGFADKWAYAMPRDKFHHLDDQWETLQEFLDFCNITEKPVIRKVMF